MASKRVISYRWRMFMPLILTFWFVVIGMASWQIYRVREVKKNMVYDQMQLVGTRVASLYSQRDGYYAEKFVRFINSFYRKSSHYDPMSIQVRDTDGTLILNMGTVLTSEIHFPEDRQSFGEMKISSGDIENAKNDMRFLYCIVHATDGKEVCVLLPYTRDVADALSASTTRFWLVLFCIGLFVTVFSYISSSYFSQNIRVLRDFANRARKKGDLVGVNVDSLPHDELGEISRQIIHIYNDREEEFDKREKEHRIALNAVQEKERIKRELTSNINHELKTPVGVIKGYIDTIVDNPGMDVETRDKFLFKAQDSVHRLTSLIEDITAITKLESGGRLVNVTEIDFHDFVFTFANYLDEAKLLVNKNMVFNYDIPLNCKVLGNESLMTSILTNLTKNAVLYSQGTKCCIEMVKEDDDFYYFRYYDDGVGVPPEHLPHMFERFYRIDPGRTRGTGGTGLGLTIVEVAIQSFGGSIDVTNRYPSGLEYNFSLPKYKKKSKE